MPTTYPMPIQEAVRDMLTDLVGRAVAVSKVAQPDDEEDGVEQPLSLLADYVTDDGAVGVLCIADIPLSAALGAALTLVPVPVVTESVRKGNFDDAEMLVENYREIVNVMARLFNSSDTPHMRWRTVYQLPTETPPDDVIALLEHPASRRDLGVTVEGYGAGTLTLLVG